MGKRITPGLFLEPELEDGYAALGFANEMTKQISSPYYMNDLIEYTHAVMSKEFDLMMQAVASANPNRFAHVYEPGKVGIQTMQLWKHSLYGRGASREAAFEWIPSVLPILKPAERATDSSDPMSKVPSEIIDKLSTEDYVFRMRAPIMEYGLKVNIVPVNAKFLFIPTFAVQNLRGKNRKSRTPSNFRFEKHNIPDFEYRNPQEPSGTDGTVGQFTAAWVGYWSGGGADDVWNSKIKPLIENGLTGREVEAEIGRATKMVRKKRRGTMTISSFNDVVAAQEAGANLARAFIKGKARSYRQAAKHVKAKGYFGGEREI